MRPDRGDLVNCVPDREPPSFPSMTMMLQLDSVDSCNALPRPEDIGLGPFFWVMRDAITVTDASSPNILLLNPAAERMFGYTLADAPSWMTIVHPRDLPRMVEAFAPLWAGRSTPILGSTAPFAATFIRKDGAERVVNAFADVLTDARTGSRYVVGICRDVTEQFAEREERGRLDGVTLTARHVAHQLNNRLAFALGSLDLLADPADRGANRSDVLREIIGELEEAAAEVAQLQRVIRVETIDTPVGPALDVARSTFPTEQPPA
jgi:PAS domain S-box-containing protein